MAITHDDLSIRSSRRSGSSSSSRRLALALVVLSILCSLSSFVLCLAAEASRSEAEWFARSSPEDREAYECLYSSSGRTPLACAVAAFLALAAAMLTEHAYMLLAVTSPTSPDLVAWTDPAAADPGSSLYRTLTWQACFLFLATWICFAIAELLLMIGMGVESGHLSRWKQLRSSCTVVQPGLFAAAGVLGLATVFLGVGLYLTALRAQRLHQKESMRQAPDASHAQHRVTPSAPPAAHQTRTPQGEQSLWKTSTSA